MIRVTDEGFEAPNLTVATGTTITVTNTGELEHSIVIEDADVNSGTIPAGESFTFSLDEPGAYDYVCDLHPTMTGTVTVQ